MNLKNFSFKTKRERDGFTNLGRKIITGGAGFTGNRQESLRF